MEREPEPRDFLREIVRKDLEEGRCETVVTRWPPEPNGYPHIGHAKSIVLNFGIAEEFGGRCHLRFDDTNPEGESMEYVEAIMRDVRWLGYDWGEHLYFASDYFERLYRYAEALIRAGKAYVCSLSLEEIRRTRGTISEPGEPSPYRERSVEENLDLFRRMRAGEFPDGAHVLRAKIDMRSPNMLMRDPLLYRIRHKRHYRVGDAWCIYPMYDFAHCLSDAIEGITHSICTLEFENNRALYDWILDNTPGIGTPRPHQYEFARLNLSHTVMSKRKLKALVEAKVVAGWDDPRMPTISGLRNRGVRPQAIRAFCERIGVTNVNSTLDMALFEHTVREDLNRAAPRYLGVLRPLEAVIEDWPEGETRWIEAPLWPRDVAREGSRRLPFGRRLWIERTDFSLSPPPGWKRLVEGGEVRLRHGCVIRCVRAERCSETGEVTRLVCTHDPDTWEGRAPEGRRVPGTIHWVSAEHAAAAEVRLYDRLFAVEQPDREAKERGVAIEELVDPRSLEILEAKLEPAAAALEPGAHLQLERHGYFFTDLEAHRAERPVLNRTVALRDRWGKLEQSGAQEGKRALEARREARRREKEERARASAAHTRKPEEIPAPSPELAALRERFTNELGLEAREAALLTREREVAELFERALAAGSGAGAEALAKWITNALAPEIKRRGAHALLEHAEKIASIVALFERGKLNNQAAKRVQEVMLERGEAPEAIIEREGLFEEVDEERLRGLIETLVREHEEAFSRLCAGESRLVGFFVGQIMRETGGKASAKRVRALLEERIAAAQGSA